MARSLNKVQLIGHLGKDPEVRYFPSGDAIANTSLATSESWTDKNSGERKEATEWHNLTFPAKLGEIAGQYLKKGSKVYVEGSLRTRKWQDKDGNDRYTTEIRVSEMLMLDGKPEGSEQRPQQQRAAAARPATRPLAETPFEDDDIPFDHP